MKKKKEKSDSPKANRSNQMDVLAELLGKVVENQEDMKGKQNQYNQDMSNRLVQLESNMAKVPMHRDPTARDLEINQQATTQMNQTLEDKGLLETKIRDLKAGEIADLLRAFAEYKHVTNPMVMASHRPSSCRLNK